MPQERLVFPIPCSQCLLPYRRGLTSLRLISIGRLSKGTRIRLPGSRRSSMVTPLPELFWGTLTLPSHGARAVVRVQPRGQRRCGLTVRTSAHTFLWILIPCPQHLEESSL